MTRPADPRAAGRATTDAGPGHPLRGVARLVRAGVLGGSSLLLAGTAHLAGGGRLPSAGVLVVLALLVGLVAVTATARRCRPAGLLALLAVEQLGLHVALGASALPPAVLGCLTGPHVHHAAAGCPPAPGAAPAAGTELGMWAAHAAAVLATAWLLSRGEAFLWRAVDRVAAAVPVLRTRSTASRRRPATPAPRRAAARRPGTTAVPRGPPLLA